MSPRILATMVAMFAAGLLVSCDNSATDAAAASAAAREDSLRKDLTEAVARANTAEAALAAAKAEAARKQADADRKIEALQAKVDDFTDKLGAAAKPVDDLQYVVVRKISIPGTLIETDPKNHPNEFSSTPSVFEVIFKGVQSGKEYPPLPVRESAYANFQVGETCTRDDLDRAKL